MIAALGRLTASSFDASSREVSDHGLLYFTANNGHGGGLYRSDGTAAGTQLVRAFTAWDASVPHELIVSHGSLFFNGDDGTEARGLWKTDGTAAGTVLVKDVRFGLTLAGSVAVIDPDLTDVNGTLYFEATPQGTDGGAVLWKSDGTAAGTPSVRVMYAGGTNGEGSLSELTNVNGTLYFVASDPGNASAAVWKSNGTAAGTTFVFSGFSFNHLTAVSGALLFTYNNVLYKTAPASQGATPLMPSMSSHFVSPDPHPTPLPTIGGIVYFNASYATLGNQLWRSDGTLSGTRMVTTINPPQSFSGLGFNPTDLTVFNGALYFAADDGTHGVELWQSNGTAAGTVMVKDIDPGAIGSSPSSLTVFNGALCFAANDGTHGAELWTTNGTTAGTRIVKDIDPGAAGSAPFLLTVLNGRLYFAADDGLHGSELWSSDGSAAGTRLVADVNTVGVGSTPQQLVNANGTVFFVANDGIHGPELFKTDGTAAGTVLVAAVAPQNLTNINGTLFFTTVDATNGTRLWKSDGTARGTVVVVTLPDHADDNLQPRPSPVGANGLLFFVVNDGVHGRQLWRSDGTAAGTRMLKPDGSGPADPFNLTVVNHTLFFLGSDPANYTALWKTDGTARGTVLVKAVSPRIITDLVGVGSSVFFATWNSGSIQLWKSDGTTTTPLLQSSFGELMDLTNVNGTLFFLSEGPNGDLVWKSNGTTAGTVTVATTPIADAMPGSLPPFPAVGVNGTFYFSVDDATNGVELWKSDGTQAGTVLVRGFPGLTSGSNTSGWPTPVGGTLYFAAGDNAHGTELWRSNGTPAGTVMVQDVNPGAGNSNPQQLLNVNGALFFTADDGQHGPELWKLGLSAVGGALSVQEGQQLSATVATFSDPDLKAGAGAYTATITWGDGHTSTGRVLATGGGTYSVAGTHTYAAAGTKTVSIQITRASCGSVSAITTVTVTDAPLSATATKSRGVKGQTITLTLGTLHDANSYATPADFTVLINWGDGQTSNGTLTPKTTGGVIVSGSHKYTTLGTFTVTATIKDRGTQAVIIKPTIVVGS
jgi:ELWxxDGT repeat protein